MVGFLVAVQFLAQELPGLQLDPGVRIRPHCACCSEWLSCHGSLCSGLRVG